MSAVACVAVDWGTSSLRLWALDSQGQALDARSSKEGMATLTPDCFGPVLEAHLRALGAGQEVPVIACGMVGSAQGWILAPYLDAPLSLSQIAQSAVQVPAIKRDVRILPGVAQRGAAPDVMRGEETLLLGSGTGLTEAAIICLPGTHSKWVRMNAGGLQSFTTHMTGEIYAILSNHSTLAPYLNARPGDPNPVFEAAVREALMTPERSLSTLFSIRAAAVLGEDHIEMPARLSGLLIGTEIAYARPDAGQSVHLIASSPLAQSYARALEVAQIGYTLHDAAEAAQAGLFQAARAIWPSWFKT